MTPGCSYPAWHETFSDHDPDVTPFTPSTLVRFYFLQSTWPPPLSFPHSLPPLPLLLPLSPSVCPSSVYPYILLVYCLLHSLGCKLHEGSTLCFSDCWSLAQCLLEGQPQGHMLSHHQHHYCTPPVQGGVGSLLTPAPGTSLSLEAGDVWVAGVSLQTVHVYPNETHTFLRKISIGGDLVSSSTPCYALLYLSWRLFCVSSNKASSFFFYSWVIF